MHQVVNLSDFDRITSNIDVSENGCWNWKGATSKSGYGVLRARNRRSNFYAHRAMCYLSGIGNPDGKLVCHTCDNRKCVNPEHLFIGSAKENVRDMISKKRNCREDGRVKAALGAKRVALRKIDEAQAADAYSRYLSGEKISSIAESIGLTYSAVYCIVKGETWSHVTGLRCPRHTWKSL